MPGMGDAGAEGARCARGACGSAAAAVRCGWAGAGFAVGGRSGAAAAPGSAPLAMSVCMQTPHGRAL